MRPNINVMAKTRATPPLELTKNVESTGQNEFAKSSRRKSSRRESLKKRETEMDVIRRLQEKSPSGIKGLAFVVREVKKA